MKKNKKLIGILIFIILLAAAFIVGRITVKSQRTLKPTEYRTLITNFDYKDEPVYVIGHKSPDTDTVSSAIAMANLLQELGIKAEARITAEPNRETAYFLKKFDVEQPEILENATGKQLWLVDHSEYSQAVDGTKEARIVGVIDHHALGDVSTSEIIYANFAEYGSTSSAVYWTYVNCGIEITPKMAAVMLSGLISDTNNMGNSESMVDRKAYDRLVKLAGLSEKELEALNEARLEQKYNHDGMTDSEIFFKDYKEYETNGIKYGIANVTVYSKDNVEGMSRRMESAINENRTKCDMDLLIYCVQNSDYSYQQVGFGGKDEVLAGEIMNTGFSEYPKKDDRTFILEPSQSRKKGIVPRVDAGINAVMAKQ